LKKDKKKNIAATSHNWGKKNTAFCDVAQVAIMF
jgi:hypothetical protein